MNSIIAKMSENENHELPNCKDFLAQIGPIDTLLGSVSYNDVDNVDGKTQQLRTSARVFKKMKFDLSINAALEKKEKEKKEEAKPEDIKQEVKKTVNPLWNSEDKKMFFEALNEYGKDFESIHMYISTRLKKKGLPDDQIKTKHQIRHFYYKTFHMLYSSLKFSDKIPKNVQELYTLINFGEMRKKVGSISKKTYSKLNDLITNGTISLRIKGKSIRVKTPMCRALRRLNQLDEKYDDLKLPTRVIVELKPKDMVSFIKVQSMAQNPRIKVALSLQKRLSSLISCISMRWKSTEAVVYDKAVISTNPNTKDCVPDEKIIDENSSLLTPLLRLAPPPDAHVELPSIDISEYFTGQSISLTAFEMRKGVKAKEEVKKEEPEVNKTEKSPSKQLSDESASCDSVKSVTTVNKVIDEAVNTILLLKTQEPQTTKSEDKNDTSKTNCKDESLEEKKIKTDNKNDVKNSVKDVTPEEKQLKIDQIKQGWTLQDCGSLTIGEIYLMFGAESKLVLEYSWDSLEVKPQLDEEESEVTTTQNNDLTNSLKKLLSLAKLHCNNKTVMKCAPGHVCGSKTTPQFKKPLTTKIVKKSHVNQSIQVGQEETSVEEKNEDPTLIASVAAEAKSDQYSNNQYFLESSSSMVHLFNQRDTIQRLRVDPKSRTRGRTRYRQLVVERKLVPNKSETKHQIVSMNIVPQENQQSEESPNQANSQNLLKDSGLPSILNETSKLNEDTCLSNKSFSSLLGDNPSGSDIGISKILKENENQWISSDVADYSLSSLLGHLDCPSKSNDDTQMSQLSQDVDAQLSTLLIEASVDYTAKFADLAAQVVDNKK